LDSRICGGLESWTCKALKSWTWEDLESWIYESLKSGVCEIRESAEDHIRRFQRVRVSVNKRFVDQREAKSKMLLQKSGFDVWTSGMLVNVWDVKDVHVWVHIRNIS
jgi:hypothetical protein